MTVSILGCGWFGKALAASLINKGVLVKGSTTTPEKLITLVEENIEAYVVKIVSPEASVIDENFFLCDVLIIANNVKIKDEAVYLQQVKTTMGYINQYNIKKVIFISSISVYGEPNAAVDETTVPVPVTTSGKLLLLAEKLLQQQTNFNCTIVRFGGLVGPNRNPANFMAGKTNIANGLAPINLIHLTDCVGITESIIFSALENLIVNAVAPHYQTKMDFYITAAENAGLPIPTFIAEKIQWKLVKSLKITYLLNYQFKTKTWQDLLV